MSETSKIFNFAGESGGLLGNGGMDGNLVAALMSGKNNQDAWGGGGCWFIWIILMFFMGWGRNGMGGFGGDSGLPAALNGDAGRELLMNAIQGNNSAIQSIATQLNTSTSAIQQGLCGVNNTLTQLSGQVGMSAQQIINSIQLGNNQLSTQLADCCCKTQNAITTMGYENQLAACQQTNTLVNTMNANTLSINSKLDEQNTQRLYDKIDALREKNSTLQFEISQRAQNEFIASQIAPINAELARLRCKETPTYAQPYLPGMPTATFTTPLCGGFYGSGYSDGGCNGGTW